VLGKKMAVSHKCVKRKNAGTQWQRPWLIKQGVFSLTLLPRQAMKPPTVKRVTVLIAVQWPFKTTVNINKLGITNLLQSVRGLQRTLSATAQ
jgi:hypothetical protein